jgi:tetratricopeptide (TPR) repeat protein
MATLSLAKDSPRALLTIESRDLLWAPGRHALVLWLADRPDEALEKTDEVSGFWKHYLKFQMCLPDLAQARKHLDRAISADPGATFALNDLADITLLEKDYAEALKLRAEVIHRNIAGKVYWIQAIAQHARAHGSRSQFAYWTAYSGLAQLTQTGAAAGALLHRMRSYNSFRWKKVLEKSETLSLTNTKWRFLFHNALWALRGEEEWETARRALFRRLLLASMSEDGQNPLVPPFSVL